MEPIILNCPHCEELVLIYENEINCKIFRHGYFKSSMSQIPPHLPKNICDELVQNEQVFGCAKPFKCIKNNDQYKLIICDYI